MMIANQICEGDTPREKLRKNLMIGFAVCAFVAGTAIPAAHAQSPSPTLPASSSLPQASGPLPGTAPAPSPTFNPSSPGTAPQQSEAPVSPAMPSSGPGAAAGSSSGSR